MSKRACRLAAFSADIRGGWGSCKDDRNMIVKLYFWNTIMLQKLWISLSVKPLEADRESVQSCWWCLPGPFAPSHWQLHPDLLHLQESQLISQTHKNTLFIKPDHQAGIISIFLLSLIRKGVYSWFTLISAVVEDIEGIHCLFSSLLVAKDQVNPLMEVTWHMLTFLGLNIQATWIVVFIQYIITDIDKCNIKIPCEI